MVHWFMVNLVNMVNLVKWHFTSGVQFSDEVESLKLEERFVEAVLYSSFIHQEPVEDPLQINLFMQNKPNLVRRRRIANERKYLITNGL